MNVLTLVGYGISASKYSETNPLAATLSKLDNYSLNLVSAAYSSSSWNSLICTKNSFSQFEILHGKSYSWPLTVETICKYVNWCFFTKKFEPSTIKTYLSNLATLHKLKNLEFSNFSSFLVKTHVRGVENLCLSNVHEKRCRRAMSLPVLKILGHEIALKNWSNDSKIVVWTAMCIAFFGSFRIGEILAKSEFAYNVIDTLIWNNVKFMDDDSVIITSNVTKNRTPGGESVSLFKFEGSFCPVTALKNLHSVLPHDPNLPVFRFVTGKLLTQRSFNNIIIECLTPHFGKKAKGFSGHSFRSGLPSALSGCEKFASVAAIKKWGRWSSDAYQRYTKLDHLAKKDIFELFKNALISKFL